MIISPVMVHTIIVSKKVPVMDIRPCSTVELVLAAAVAMGALPRPDSFEKTPLATPLLMASMTLAPRKPPLAAVVVKALLNISFIVFGISSKFNPIINMEPATYKITIKGTSTSAILDILLIPLIVTRATKMVKIAVVKATGILKIILADVVMAFTW